MEELDTGTYDILWVLYQRDQELENAPGANHMRNNLFARGNIFDKVVDETRPLPRILGRSWEIMQAESLSYPAR